MHCHLHECHVAYACQITSQCGLIKERSNGGDGSTVCTAVCTPYIYINIKQQDWPRMDPGYRLEYFRVCKYFHKCI